MEEQAQSHDPRRLFYSDLKDDNLLDCIVSKVTIVQISPCVGLHFVFYYIFSCDNCGLLRLNPVRIMILILCYR